MAKKNGLGLLTLVTGIAAGAAAVFLSKKENRVRAQKELKKAGTYAQKVAKDLEKDPQKTAIALKKQAKSTAQKAVKSAQKRASSVIKKKTRV